MRRDHVGARVLYLHTPGRMKFKALLFVSALATPAFADTNAKLSNDEVQTLQHVHHVNQMEIDLAKVAQKAGSPAVQALAAEILKDHQQADKDLMALAAKKKVTATTETSDDKQADKDMQKDVDHLKTLKGKDFDKEYASMMAEGHTKEISKLDAAISSGSDTDVKGFLEKIKPNLQKHADDAKQLAGKANS